MPTSVTLPVSALATLVGQFAYPNPDDPEPHGPGGPVIRNRGEWVYLNPQPLPPVEKWGPQPEPWRFAAAVRTSIGHILTTVELAGIIIVGGDAERPTAFAKQAVSDLVDEWCGTPPRPRPFPGPWGPTLDEPLSVLNLIVAAVQVQRAADSVAGTPTGDILDGAAGRLFEVAAERAQHQG